MIKHIQAAGGNKPKETLVNIQRWTKTNPTLIVTQTSSETLLNSFLYSYLLYNPCIFDPLFETRTDDKMRELQKIYNAMVKYFTVFKLSRNPFTVCWLLEILNIVCLKFNLQEAKLDTRLRKDYHDLFNNMLGMFSAILTDASNVQFHETQAYGLAFPPTVYELLWRYEYICFKSSISDAGESGMVHQMLDQASKDPSSLDRGDLGPLSQLTRASQLHKVPMPSQQSDVVQSNGSVFFNKAVLKMMVDQKFEYQHSGGSQTNDQSIFKNMEILMKDRANLADDYLRQSDFMERIKFAVRGETNPEEMLIQCKFFSIITLKQILCQLLVNLVGTSDTEKTNKSMQIILGAAIQSLQSDNKAGKSQKFSVMNEFICEFFASVVERSHQIDPSLLKPYRREIIDLFNFDSFFQASKLNLK